LQLDQSKLVALRARAGRQGGDRGVVEAGAGLKRRKDDHTEEAQADPEADARLACDIRAELGRRGQHMLVNVMTLGERDGVLGVLAALSLLGGE
jgi:hypothetical protein